jgi:hypothetical protein
MFLSRLMNKLKPGSIAKIHTSGGPMKLRENIGLFQNAARSYGVGDSEVFQAVDLFDKQNIQQVTVGVLYPSLSLTGLSSLDVLVMYFCFKSSGTKTKLQRTEAKLSDEVAYLRLNNKRPEYSLSFKLNLFSQLEHFQCSSLINLTTYSSCLSLFRNTRLLKFITTDTSDP